MSNTPTDETAAHEDDKGLDPPNRLRFWRKAKKFNSGEAFVEAMTAAGYPLSKNYLYMFETGERPLSNLWRLKFAKVLDIDPDLICPNPDRLEEALEGYTSPPPFEVTPEMQAGRYYRRDYFRDIRYLVEAMYSEEGAPLPADEYWVIASDIEHEVPFDGETRAEDSAGVAECLAARRRLVRMQLFPRPAAPHA